jgi:predicted secreted protein
MPINRFVHEQNLKYLRALLARTIDEAERRRIVGLIEEEEAKNAGRSPLRENP